MFSASRNLSISNLFFFGADRPGQTSTTLLWRTERRPLQSFESWRFRPTKHSTRIVKCTCHFPSLGISHIPLQSGSSSLNNRYYEGGVSSVYLWDLDDGGFAGVVLFKKSMSA